MHLWVTNGTTSKGINVDVALLWEHSHTKAHLLSRQELA